MHCSSRPLVEISGPRAYCRNRSSRRDSVDETVGAATRDASLTETAGADSRSDPPQFRRGNRTFWKRRRLPRHFHGIPFRHVAVQQSADAHCWGAPSLERRLHRRGAQLRPATKTHSGRCCYWARAGNSAKSLVTTALIAASGLAITSWVSFPSATPSHSSAFLRASATSMLAVPTL
jgi:hypothetical protein